MLDPLNASYPVLTLRDIVVFPFMIVPLFVGREKSVRALEEVMQDDKQILLSSQKDPAEDDPDKDGIGYVNLPVKAQKPSEQLDYAKLSICLTALDNRRPILKNLVAKKPKHIINPLSFL